VIFLTAFGILGLGFVSPQYEQVDTLRFGKQQALLTALNLQAVPGRSHHIMSGNQNGIVTSHAYLESGSDVARATELRGYALRTAVRLTVPW
jgi:hypothetical protein